MDDFFRNCLSLGGSVKVYPSRGILTVRRGKKFFNTSGPVGFYFRSGTYITPRLAKRNISKLKEWRSTSPNTYISIRTSDNRKKISLIRYDGYGFAIKKSTIRLSTVSIGPCDHEKGNKSVRSKFNRKS